MRGRSTSIGLPWRPLAAHANVLDMRRLLLAGCAAIFASCGGERAEGHVAGIADAADAIDDVSVTIDAEDADGPPEGSVDTSAANDATLDARLEVGIDDASDGSLSDDSVTPTEAGCFVDFPCESWEAWQCDDDGHATARESHDCHFACGPGPCSGGSCDPTGAKTTCVPGTHCVEQLPSWGDGGPTKLDGPCQPIESADAATG